MQDDEQSSCSKSCKATRDDDGVETKRLEDEQKGVVVEGDTHSSTHESTYDSCTRVNPQHHQLPVEANASRKDKHDDHGGAASPPSSSSSSKASICYRRNQQVKVVVGLPKKINGDTGEEAKTAGQLPNLVIIRNSQEEGDEEAAAPPPSSVVIKDKGLSLAAVRAAQRLSVVGYHPTGDVPVDYPSLPRNAATRADEHVPRVTPIPNNNSYHIIPADASKLQRASEVEERKQRPRQEDQQVTASADPSMSAASNGGKEELQDEAHPSKKDNLISLGAVRVAQRLSVGSIPGAVPISPPPPCNTVDEDSPEQAPPRSITSSGSIIGSSNSTEQLLAATTDPHDDEEEEERNMESSRSSSSSTGTQCQEQVLLQATLVDTTHVEATPVDNIFDGTQDYTMNGSSVRKSVEEMTLMDMLHMLQQNPACRQLTLIVGMVCIMVVLSTVILAPLFLTPSADPTNGVSTRRNDNTATSEPLPIRRPPFSNKLDTSVLNEMKGNPYGSQALANEWMWDDPYRYNYSEERQRQRFVLVSSYFATNAENTWKRNDSWASYDVSECNWYTAHPNTTSICDDDDTVRIINLTNNGLKGTIPNEMLLYTRTKIADVSHNSLYGTIPIMSKEVSGIEVIDYSYNNLEGPFGLVLMGRLEMSLRVFKVRNNSFSGQFPVDNGLMPNLTIVDASNNHFGGDLPTLLGAVSQLEVVLVANNQLAGTVSSSIQELTNLRVVDLSNNPDIDGTIPNQVGQLANLQSVDLSNTGIKGSIPQRLCQRESDGELDLLVGQCAMEGQQEGMIQCCPSP